MGDGLVFVVFLGYVNAKLLVENQLGHFVVVILQGNMKWSVSVFVSVVDIKHVNHALWVL